MNLEFNLEDCSEITSFHSFQSAIKERLFLSNYGSRSRLNEENIDKMICLYYNRFNILK